MTRGALLAAALVAASLTAGTGCAGGTDRVDAASGTAESFLRALRAGDGEAACRALAPRTREELTGSSGTRCPRAVTGLPVTEQPVPGDPAARQVDVYGGEARVVALGDTVFLSRFDGAWKVTAAGCLARPGAPGYDCEIQGG